MEHRLAHQVQAVLQVEVYADGKPCQEAQSGHKGWFGRPLGVGTEHTCLRRQQRPGRQPGVGDSALNLLADDAAEWLCGVERWYSRVLPPPMMIPVAWRISPEAASVSGMPSSLRTMNCRRVTPRRNQ